MSDRDNGFRAAQRSYDNATPPEDIEVDCASCNGNGGMDEECKECEGTGVVSISEAEYRRMLVASKAEEAAADEPRERFFDEEG